MNFKSILIRRSIATTILLFVAIMLNSTANGMELITMSTVQTRPYYETPGDVIAQIAAYCSQKNTLMRLNKAWHKFCSRKNAANILIHDPITLSLCDKQYFLNYFAYEGNQPIVTNLLKNGADINCTTYSGMNPLHCACDNLNNEKMITLLIDCGAQSIPRDKELPFISPLYKAVYYGKVSLVKSLVRTLKKDINKRISPNKMSSLMLASVRGNYDIVQILLKNKAKVDLTDLTKRTSLQYACDNGHFGVAQLLLSHKADPHFKGEHHWTPLHFACRKGYSDIAQLLLEYKADVNAMIDNNSASLHIACECGHLDTVQLLLKYNADVDAEGKYKMTPLHWACQNGHLDIVQLLLTHGVNASKKDDSGNTPLQTAYEKGHAHIVKFFADHMSNLKK